MNVADNLNSLYHLSKADIDSVSKIEAKAFIEAGDYSYLSAKYAKRLKYLTQLVKVAYSYTINFGKAYATSENLEGVAAWLPHDKVKITT